MNTRITTDLDSYKCSHPWQYPKDTQLLFGYLESRYGRYPNKKSKKGALDLIINDKGEYQTVNRLDEPRDGTWPASQFVTYYNNGPTDYVDTFENIRKRAKEALDSER